MSQRHIEHGGDFDDFADETDDGALDDRDAPQESDLSEDESEETVACSRCGRQVWELADRCRFCGEHLVAGAAPPRSPGRVAIALAALLALLAGTFWLLR